VTPISVRYANIQLRELVGSYPIRTLCYLNTGQNFDKNLHF